MNDPETAKGFARQDWHARPSETVAAELAVDPARGLSGAEMQRRLAIHGPNELAQEETTSAYTIFAHQFMSMVIWILILAALVSAAMGERVDAIAIVAIVVLNAVIGFFQEYRSEKAVAELKCMAAPKGRVLRDGQAGIVPASVLIPGGLTPFGIPFISYTAALLGIISLVVISPWAASRLAAPTNRILSTTGINIVIRLFRLILMVVAAEFIAKGLIELFPILRGPI